MLKAAIRDPNPVVFCEHKYLYQRIKARLPQTEGALDDRDQGDTVPVLGRARVLREGRDLTFVAWSVATHTCLDAAEELVKEGVKAEVVDLRTLVPFDADTVLASVQKTGRAVVVHEATLTGGFGGEVAARIGEDAFAWLDAPVKRVASVDRPSPFFKKLEQDLLPDLGKVLAAARETLKY